jgi:hypothetical protein
MYLIKTEAGQQALKDRSLLTPRQRSAFIQFDGKRSLTEVLQASAGLGITATDIDHLISLGLLAPVAVTTELEMPSTASASGVAEILLTVQDRFKRAYPLAAQLTGSLGLRGFRLNLAVEGAADLQALQALLPDIRKAVGNVKIKPLENALSG